VGNCRLQVLGRRKLLDQLARKPDGNRWRVCHLDLKRRPFSYENGVLRYRFHFSGHEPYPEGHGCFLEISAEKRYQSFFCLLDARGSVCSDRLALG
jgi:hypothetical protein